MDKTYQLNHYCPLLILATDADSSCPSLVEQQHLALVRACMYQLTFLNGLCDTQLDAVPLFTQGKVHLCEQGPVHQ